MGRRISDFMTTRRERRIQAGRQAAHDWRAHMSPEEYAVTEQAYEELYREPDRLFPVGLCADDLITLAYLVTDALFARDRGGPDNEKLMHLNRSVAKAMGDVGPANARLMELRRRSIAD